ncbi:MAG: YhcH/YjgK/YiaL family protein [Brevinema sp.]
MILTTFDRLNIEHFNNGNFKNTLTFLLKNKDEMFAKPVGKYQVCEEFFYIIQEYESKEYASWEAHEKYIDIQILISGEEMILLADRSHLKATTAYDSEKDWIEFEGEARTSSIFSTGDVGIFFPRDAHKPGLCSPHYKGTIRKCIVKVTL